MKVIADIAIIPIGVGVSLSKYIASCERVLSEAGLEPSLHEMGAPRVSTNLRIGTRVDRTQSMQNKIDSVKQKL